MSSYEAILKKLANLPKGTPAVLLLRHSTRFPIRDDASIYTTGLTPSGIQLAESFGVELGRLYQTGRLVASPVGRCIDTANAIRRGAGWSGPVVQDFRLTHLFIEAAWERLAQGGYEPGHIPTQVGHLANLLLHKNGKPAGLEVLVTHDTVVGLVVSYFVGERIVYPANWPDYLEGVVISHEDETIRLAWRDKVVRIADPKK